MRVLFIDSPHPILLDQLHAEGVECVCDYSSNEAEVAASIKDFDGVVLRSRISFKKDLIDKATSLKFIAREGVGLEHIDVAYAQSRGIEVLTSPEGSRNAVGEHTLGMLLCLLHKISVAHAQVRKGEWIRESNRGVELGGKTVGIMGYGNMGSSFAKKLSGFDCRVISYDRYKSKYEDKYTTEVDLPALQKEADILSLHFPYSSENHYFIDADFIQKMDKNIYLLNTARGLVLKTDDIVESMKAGKILGAALDVLDYEDTSFDKFSLKTLPESFDYLSKAENVVLTPHIAGWSFESKRGHAEALLKKIKDVLFS